MSVTKTILIFSGSQQPNSDPRSNPGAAALDPAREQRRGQQPGEHRRTTGGQREHLYITQLVLRARFFG